MDLLTKVRASRSPSGTHINFVVPFSCQRDKHYIWGSAIGAAANLLGSGISAITGNSTNKNNLKMMREQNDFNAKESKKQRDWQESMYQKYQSRSAQASDLRAAGLNAQLADTTQMGIGQGSTASASESVPQQNYVGEAVQNGLQNAVNAYNSSTAVQSQKELNESTDALQKTQQALNDANAAKTRSDNYISFLQGSLLQKTFKDQVEQVHQKTLQSQFETTSSKWASCRAEFDYLHIAPQQIDNMRNEGLLICGKAYEAFANGKLSLQKVDDIIQEWSFRQIDQQLKRMEISVQQDANDINRKAVNQQGEFLKAQGAYYKSLTKVQYQQLWEMKKWNPVKYAQQIKNMGKTGFLIDAQINSTDALTDYYKSGAFRNYVGGGSEIFGDIPYDLYQQAHKNDESNIITEKFGPDGEYRGSTRTRKTGSSSSSSKSGKKMKGRRKR